MRNMSFDLVQKIREGQTYQRKTGERCLINSIDGVTNENNNQSFEIRFRLFGGNNNTQRWQKEPIEFFLENTIVE